MLEDTTLTEEQRDLVATMCVPLRPWARARRSDASALAAGCLARHC